MTDYRIKVTKPCTFPHCHAGQVRVMDAHGPEHIIRTDCPGREPVELTLALFVDLITEPMLDRLRMAWERRRRG